MTGSARPPDLAGDDDSGALGCEPDRPRRRGRPPAADGAQTRDRILWAARETFSELGYDKTSITVIADRSGLTRTAVSHYFSNKEALYGALFDAVRDGVVRASLTTGAAEYRGVARQITAFVQAAARMDSQDPSYARFIAASLLDSFRHPELRERARDQLDDVRAFLAQSLTHAAQRGEIDARTDVDAVTEMLVAALWGMGLYAGYVGTQHQLEQVVDQFGRMLEGTLWGPAEGHDPQHI
ncbi:MULTISPECIES: TetR/AcrR family transcriptional regulator [unclassified Pseudonocardia]|uniref:TetR/AcrR family transcriptional regulator n=1 Tax=unclassified Pseudonocardia TaxID=2619320 RepID=UPI0001FFE4AF|nr:TetR/AcrR family transcriptional regulator [Pseudonocardia sp. Ae707_Ps1]OLM16743.1 Transcriptional regulator, TetR family [Pseudonocardia sp. Ae707_Ps1]